jgi:tetratricopeptide (TPR) repeat protein
MPYKRVVLFLLFAVVLSAATDKRQNWLKVQSPHFLVITNGSEKQGRHAADQLERMRMVFHLQFPAMHVDPASPIVVIAVKEEKDFRTLEPADYLGKGKLQLAGLFLRAADKNYILLRLDVEGEHPYATVYHEYTHLITSRSEDWLPIWLNEGWAEFYQMTELRDKEAMLGEASPENILLLRQNQLLPLSVLLTVDHNSPYYHEENKGSIFYAESWVLTHYLIITDAIQHLHRLDDYLLALTKGMDSVTAANHAFGNLQKLQDSLQSYIEQNRFNYFRLPGVTQVDQSSFKVEPLPGAQADAVRADLLVYTRRTADARSLLEAVLKEDPNNSSARETLGFLAIQEHKLQEARKWYSEAVKLNSQSYLANYYFATMSMDAGPLSAEDDVQVEKSLHACIKLNPDFAPSYDVLGSLYGSSHRNLDEALAAELKATQLDPANLSYKLNYANILLQMDRTKEAIKLIRGWMSLATDAVDRERFRSFLESAEHYETAKAEAAEYNRRGSQESAAQSLSGVTTDSGPPTLSRRAGAVTNSYANPPLPLPEKDVTGPHRFVVGKIKGVQCSQISAMDFVVVSGGKEIALHTPNYYKVEYSALGFTPEGELKPCTQIEGRAAKVEFIEPTDRSAKNRIVAVELHK